MTQTAHSNHPGLRRVGVRPALPSYLRQVWSRRDFAIVFARSRITARNQQNRFGLAWLVITPILDALIYGTVFGVLQGGKRPDHFVLFLIIGIFFFRYFSDSVSRGARAIISNRALVQSLSFPRMVLPLSTAIEEAINFLPMLAILLIVATPLGATPSLRWLYLVPVLLLTILLYTGITLIMARTAVHFRDITQIVPFGNRFMRYFSGVFYAPVKFIPEASAIMLFFELNPLYNILELARYALIPDYYVKPIIVIGGIAWSVGIFLFGIWYFWSAEERYGSTN